jgi:hypothetical protein
MTVNKRIGSRKKAISGSHIRKIADKKTTYNEGCLYISLLNYHAWPRSLYYNHFHMSQTQVQHLEMQVNVGLTLGLPFRTKINLFNNAISWVKANCNCFKIDGC